MARHAVPLRRPRRLTLGMAIVWALLLAGIFIAFHTGPATSARQCVTVGTASLYCTR